MENDYLCYDITSISSYAQANEFVRYGYNRDGERLPQINMAMLFGQKGKLSAYYRRMQGNISDVSTLKTTMKSLDFLGTAHAHFVLDRGFYSRSNIDELLKRRHHFTIAIPSGRKWVEAIIDDHYESIASPSNYHETGENEALYTSTVLHWWGDERRRTYLHIYYNASRAAKEYETLARYRPAYEDIGDPAWEEDITTRGFAGLLRQALKGNPLTMVMLADYYKYCNPMDTGMLRIFCGVPLRQSQKPLTKPMISVWWNLLIPGARSLEASISIHFTEMKVVLFSILYPPFYTGKTHQNFDI